QTLMNDILRPESNVEIINLWLMTVQQFSGLLLDNDALVARQKATAIAQHSLNVFNNSIINRPNVNKGPGAPPKRPGPPSSNDNADPDLEGAIIHNPESIVSV